MKRFSREEPDEGTSLLGIHKGKNEGKSPAKYPRAVFFIVGNEFCERFSYYGMRVILVLFLTNALLYSEDTATVIFHAFTMGCYFTPLFGAMLADSLLGKFRTILYISIVYCIGNTVISIAAVPDLLPMRSFTMVGLIFIAVGTGGIKPCVSAFGADQFSEDQEKEQKRFFSFFYLSINSGGLVSMFLTPILRAEVQCFGEETCFPLAFGVPAVLMVLSLILFIAGRPFYKIIPPSGNVMLDVTRCTSHAVVQKFKSKKEGVVKGHWLDYADDKFSRSLISDIKVLLRILLLYLPLPVFWALSDQQGSRWTLQATRLNGSFLGYTIKPDQINVLNPILVVLLIPVFEYALYPLFAKCNLLTRPLQRITVGGLLAGIAFLVAGVLQLSIEVSSSYSVDEPAAISILWQIPQHVLLTSGEVMFSITGLEFSYSQAPKSMKSVLQACWHLTVAFGNLLVLIIARLQLFQRQSYEFFMFAGLMVVDMLLFAILAYFYKCERTDRETNQIVPPFDDEASEKSVGFQERNQM